MSDFLEIVGLSAGYDQGNDILHGIDFSMKENSRVGIMGQNGSGKSTFGKAIMNMLPYRQGRLIFQGEDVSKLRSFELSSRGITIMLQGGLVFSTMSVYDNLRMAFGGKYENLCSSQMRDIIPLLNESKNVLKQSKADRLSGGQRHQLALSMALAQRPKLLVLDEPTAGLSPSAVTEMYKILSRVCEQFGVSVILIEHNVAEAVRFCDRCQIMVSGNFEFEEDNCDYQLIQRQYIKY